MSLYVTHGVSGICEYPGCQDRALYHPLVVPLTAAFTPDEELRYPETFLSCEKHRRVVEMKHLQVYAGRQDRR